MYKQWIQLWRIDWFKAIVLNINKRKYEYNMTEDSGHIVILEAHVYHVLQRHCECWIYRSKLLWFYNNNILIVGVP